MRSKNYLILLVCALVFFNTILIVKNRYYKTLIELEKSEKVLPIIDLECTAMQYANTPLFIDKIKKTDSLTLCLFVSEYHCQSCIDSAIIQMKSYCTSRGIDFILLADYSSPRVALLLKKINTSETSIRFINMTNHDYAISKCNYPLIFVYNSFLNIAEHIFVPDINNPEIAKGYLSLIESKLFID